MYIINIICNYLYLMIITAQLFSGGPPVGYHIALALVQAATLAAFLILWRLWVRKKLTASFLIEDEDRILFPFKYFSWILFGVVLVTSLAQIHFIWVSFKTEKNLAAMKNVYKMAEKHGQTVEETKLLVEKLTRELELNTKAVKLFSRELPVNAKTSRVMTDLRVAQADASPRNIQTRSSHVSDSFDQEAKASSKERASSESKHRDEVTAGEEPAEVNQSMRLNRRGSVVGNGLRVRKSPDESSDVVETLTAGKHVKVTEKKFQKDRVWFRIITPSGRAGWVDFNFVKLENNA